MGATASMAAGTCTSGGDRGRTAARGCESAIGGWGWKGGGGMVVVGREVDRRYTA